jgi:hypothetical protein
MVTYKDFLPLFNTEIYFDDNRSSTMPRINVKGLIIGIRLDSIEIRERNKITHWLPIYSNSLIWHI